MPKMTFADENKAKSQYEFNKLTLEKGERARITTIEAEPEYEFVHALRAPQIINGQAVMEVENFKTKSGENQSREVMKTDFIGQHICIGDLNALADTGADPKNCPVCKVAKESDAVDPAKRKFAMHIIRYKTQPGGFLIQDPFTVELVVWSFADKVFNSLTDLAQEWGNLQLKDLNLGPCEGKQYQKFDINVASKAEWLESDARKEQVKAVYQNNKLADLTVALGRRLTRDQVEEDLERVLTRYEIATGRKEATVIDLGNQVDVGNLLGDDIATTPTQETKPTEPSPESSTEAASDPLAEFAAPESEEKKDEDAVMSLEDILKL